MSHNLLQGKRGIIFGALNSESIAWKVAEKAVEEGAAITLSNTPVALRMGELNVLSEKLNAPVIPADATSVEDLEKVFEERATPGRKNRLRAAFHWHESECAQAPHLR